MALVKFGGGIVAMSGSIAGNTFARNRSGPYVRARTKPINPNTALQVAIRAALAELTSRWSLILTPAQRTAWNLYAASVNMLNKLGETINLSGFNHFIRSNSVRTRYAIAPVDAGPTLFELPPQDPALSFTCSEATQTITLAFDDVFPWASEDGAHLAVYMGQPQNAQRNFFNGPWRNTAILFGSSGVPLTTPQVIPLSFVASEGQRVWIYARISRADGRISEKFSANNFCAA